MTYPKIPLAQSLIEICALKGINNIIISPGSRNAPLTLGFVGRSEFNCFSIVDERSAAFFALGKAQQLREPVALVCTSGSALLNYYPAVAEAFYSEIPLLIISADRPLSKIDIGDGQTIRQQHVFANHILFSANLSEEVSVENDFLINKAITISKSQKGPVHINVPFEEPLYQMTSTPSVSVTNIEIGIEKKTNQIENFDELAAIWNQTSKKLVLVGTCFPETIDESNTTFLANESSVVVMNETLSNWNHEKFITSIDTLITPFNEADFEAFQPELLVTFGGMLVSKRVKAMLRTYTPKNHWHIDTLRFYDTFGCLTASIIAEPNDFFAKIKEQSVPLKSTYNSLAQKIKQYRNRKHQEYLQKMPFCDFKAFELIIPSLPKNIHLQFSNSSAIRYAQLIPIDFSIHVFCNRGTSGIDGSTSTAIGAATISKRPTVFITGDIGFFYDCNALWNAYIPKNFKIIIINNGGGGIFRILPGHKDTPVFNTFFETAHSRTAEYFAKMYGFTYLKASDAATLQQSLLSFYNQNDLPAILEVFTPMLENDAVLKEYFNFVG